MDALEWVSVSEASRRLKLSPSEIRRRVKAGMLVGERVARGPGDTRDRFMVHLPLTTYLQVPRAEDAPSDAPPRADSERLLGIIDALLRTNAETMVRQADEIARLMTRVLDAERDLARYHAERDAAVERAELDRQSADLLQAVADRQRERIVELERQLEQARRRRWYDPRTW